MRYSICLELGDAAKAPLIDFQAKLKAKFDFLSPIAPEGLFAVMKFLGEPGPVKVKSLVASLEESSKHSAPFDMTISGLGCFPNDGPARVVWASVTDSFHMLARLHKDCNERYARLGFDKNSSDFIPHIVLGRAQTNNSKGRLRKAVMDARWEPIIQRVTHVSLVSSDVTKDGTRYEVVATKALEATVHGA